MYRIEKVVQSTEAKFTVFTNCILSYSRGRATRQKDCISTHPQLFPGPQSYVSILVGIPLPLAAL